MENQVWTVKRILDWIEGYLADHEDENPKLSAQWLVSEALGLSRIQLFMDQDRPLSMDERDTLRDYTRRRAAGEPLQYITGTTDFRFITVMVEPGVLIPRPETEVLVSEALSELETALQVKAARWAEAAKADARFQDFAPEGEEGEFIQEHDSEEASSLPGAAPAQDAAIDAPEPLALTALDICTGSGCIACSIASEVPYAQVIATDIDPVAVDLARRNAAALGLESRVDVIECDLADGVDSALMGSIDLLISNPPYIPTSVLGSLDAQVTEYESVLALDGGEDGLDIFRRILPIGIDALRVGGVLALELHETCLEQAACEARKAGYANVRIVEDLAGRPRVLVARKE